MQETPEIVIASSSATLGDVRFDGDGATSNLTSEPKSLLDRKPASPLIDRETQTVSFSPNFKSPEVLHNSSNLIS